MSKMIQIRNVPDPLHRTLKVRAAEAGLSLSDYLMKEIARVAERPTNAEILARLRELPPVHVTRPPSETIRALRDRE